MFVSFSSDHFHSIGFFSLAPCFYATLENIQKPVFYQLFDFQRPAVIVFSQTFLYGMDDVRLPSFFLPPSSLVTYTLYEQENTTYIDYTDFLYLLPSS